MPSPASSQSTSTIKFIVLILIVAAGILLFRYTPFSEYTEPAQLQGILNSIIGFWWAPLIYVGVYAGGTLVAAPGALLTILGGLTFGVVNGFLYVLVGANIGASLSFGLARVLGRDFVANRVKGPLDTIDRQLQNQGFLRILQLRLIPLVPFNILNYAAGLSGVRYTHYMMGTLIGMVPGIFVYVYSASALAQLYLAGAGTQDEAALAAARTTALTNVGLSLGLLIIISLIPYVYRRFKNSGQ